MEKLSIGIYELNETEILNAANFKQLTELSLMATKTKALNLEYLREYSILKKLGIAGHTKNISAIGELQNLQSLSLNSIKKIPVPFVNQLKKLKSLKFLLGGRENLHEIEENEIEHLEIVWVRGFNDIGNISKFSKLRFLRVEDNIQLKSIHFNKEMRFLKTLSISNCKTLNSLTGLQNLTSLERIGIYQTKIDFENFISQPLPQSLKAINFFTSGKKLNNLIKLKIKESGYTD